MRVNKNTANHEHVLIQYLDGELCQVTEQILEIAHQVNVNNTDSLRNAIP